MRITKKRSPRLILQSLVKNGYIEGVIRFGRSFAIPETAEKPADGRRAAQGGDGDRGLHAGGTGRRDAPARCT